MDEFEMWSNDRTFLLFGSWPGTNTRQAVTCILTCCCDESQDCASIDQIHHVDAVLHIILVVLDNAKAINPEISFANVCSEVHSIRDDRRQLRSCFQKATRFHKILNRATISPKGRAIAPDVAQCQVTSTRRESSQAIFLDIDEVQRWQECFETGGIPHRSNYIRSTARCLQIGTLITMDRLTLCEPPPDHLW
jgi:hypothetical protein